MKLIEPKVELLSELDITPESHIARCARVCYGKEYKESNQEADEKMVEGLIKRGHLSMLRHASTYISDLPYASGYLQEHIIHSPYWNYSLGLGYASTNFQESMQQEVEKEAVPGISNSKFLDECSKHPELFELYRMTFCITTQISTSRELNRCSPNAIAERSTRYCSSKDGLEICKPWWFNEIPKDFSALSIRKLPIKEKIFAWAWRDAEMSYATAIENGMKPEDVRGLLPLDTATKVIYTYSVQEWQHILDLRYYGTTGKPHPNAKLIAGKIRDEINKFAIEHGINYKV